MKLFTETCTLWLSCILLLSGMNISAFSYYYSSTTKCLVEPQRAQYGGGMIVNPEFNHSLEGWTVFGQGEIEERISKAGNSFIVVHSRTHPLDSLSQKVLLEKGKLYSFSAWIQISEGRETVSVLFKTTDELVRGGKVIAEHGCWSLLKGGIIANFSTHVEILFESKNTKVDIWVDNVSLQPFTKEQWKSHQDISISKAQHLEDILREGYSHPAVKGIVMFAGPIAANFKEMPLADINFNNTPAGDVVDKLLHEWKHSQALEFTADDKGFVDVLLFHGDYNVTVQHTEANSSTTLGFRVTKDTPQATINVRIRT